MSADMITIGIFHRDRQFSDISLWIMNVEKYVLCRPRGMKNGDESLAPGSYLTVR
jgi:hypothetical protein